MATNYPGTIDTFTNPAGTSVVTSPDHAAQHTNINDAMLAVQNALGTTAGTALFAAFGTADKPEKKGVITMGTTAYTTSGSLATGQYLQYNGTNIIGGTAGASGPASTLAFGTANIGLATVAPSANQYLQYNGTSIVGQSGFGTNSFIWNETLSGATNGTNTVFTLAGTPVAGAQLIFRDGQLMNSGTNDYSISANTVTMVSAPVGTTALIAYYMQPGVSSGNADTLDGFHANSTPTAGQIPVLDSEMAMIGNSMARQAVINGNFDIWQRGTTVTGLAANGFIADRWKWLPVLDGGTNPTIIQSRQLLTSGAIPNAFYHYRINPNGAGSGYGVNSYNVLMQLIENGTRFLCGASKKVTVSFWARSDIANKRLGISLLQSYGTGGSPSSAEWINTQAPITLTSSWTKYTVTFTTNTLVGKTFGTANDDSLSISFFVQWGATIGNTIVYPSVTAETFVGSGNIDIAQVQLCAGDVALPFMPKSYGQELLDCQRYCYVAGDLVNSGYLTIAGGQCLTTATTTIVITYPIKMRKVPTTTYNTAASYAVLNASGSAIAASGITDGVIGIFASRITPSVSSGLVAGDATQLIQNGAAAGIIFDAEL